jgi:eukaryotic-like serine/threonine-protein kinase
MGEVYRARDTRLDRLVAIKVLPARLGSIPGSLERFQREARAIAALNHPNICTIHDVDSGEAGGPPYLAMELLEGETLHRRLQRGALSVQEIVDIGSALADALDAAHAKGIIHRDIKPANILLTARGPKILDFGLAKAAAGDAVRGSLEATRSVDAPLTIPARRSARSRTCLPSS